MTVVASAVGPLLLAACVEMTGSYAAMFYVLAGAVGAVSGAAAIVRCPPPHAEGPALKCRRQGKSLEKPSSDEALLSGLLCKDQRPRRSP